MRLFGRGKNKKQDKKGAKPKKHDKHKHREERHEDKHKHEEPKEKQKEGKKGPEKAEEKKKPEEQHPEKKKRRFGPRIKIIPRGYVNWVDEQLTFSGSSRDPGKFIWVIIIISLIVSGGFGFGFRPIMYYVSPAVFLLMFSFFNFILILSVDRRARFVDEILPDALNLVSANIRSGYIPSRALILSARKEFGPLAEAIKRSGKEIMSGKSLEEGLKDIPAKIKSEDLRRTIDLIIQGVRGGGQIVALLEENAMDIRRRQAIKKEIRANTMMYAIFIAFAGCLGAPGLYALSTYLTNTMSHLGPDATQTSQISGKVSFVQLQGVEISPDFLFQFSIAAILLTTIFGGLILGLIGSGREKDGLKYAPVLSVIALLVYFGATFLLTTMFATMLPG